VSRQGGGGGGEVNLNFFSPESDLKTHLNFGHHFFSFAIKI